MSRPARRSAGRRRLSAERDASASARDTESARERARAIDASTLRRIDARTRRDIEARARRARERVERARGRRQVVTRTALTTRARRETRETEARDEVVPRVYHRAPRHGVLSVDERDRRRRARRHAREALHHAAGAATHKSSDSHRARVLVAELDLARDRK